MKFTGTGYQSINPRAVRVFNDYQFTGSTVSGSPSPSSAAQTGSVASIRTARVRRPKMKLPAVVKANANTRVSALTFSVSRLAWEVRRALRFPRPPPPSSTRSGRVSSLAARRDPPNPPLASASLRSCASARIARDGGRRPSRQKRHLRARLRPRNIAPAAG